MKQRLPTSLLWGAVLAIVITLVRLVEYGGDVVSVMKFQVVDSGLVFAQSALLAAGLFEYAQGVTPGRATGARIAAWVQIAMIALRFMNHLLRMQLTTEQGFHQINEVMGYAFPVLALGFAVGMLRATRVNVAGGIAIVTVLIGQPVPELREAIEHAAGLGHHGVTMIWLVPAAVLAFTYLSMIVKAPPVVAPPADPGAMLRSAASSVTFRLLAAFALMGIMLASPFVQAESLGVIKLVLVLGPAIDAIALIVLARAMLRFPQERELATFAAFGALFAAGALVYRVPLVHAQLYNPLGHLTPHDEIPLFQWLVPIASCVATVLSLRVVEQVARSRDPGLQEKVAIRTALFAVMTLGVIALMRYGFAGESDNALLMIVGGFVGSIWSLALAKRVFVEGAEMFERDASKLPVATVV